MKPWLACLFLFSLSTSAFSEATIQEQIPPKTEIVEIAEGDLNGDGRPDAAVTVRGTDPELIKPAEMLVGQVGVEPQTGKLRYYLNTNPRQLLVFLAQAEGGYRLLASNRELLPTPQFPFGDSLEKVVIDGGALRVHLLWMDRRHGIVGARQSYIFRMIGDELVLSSAEKLTSDRYVTDSDVVRRYDFVEKKVDIQVSKFSTRQPLTQETRPIEIGLPLFSQVKCGWELEKGYWL